MFKCHYKYLKKKGMSSTLLLRNYSGLQEPLQSITKNSQGIFSCPPTRANDCSTIQRLFQRRLNETRDVSNF